MNISNQSNWLFEQEVTYTQMNTLSNDIYDKLTALTQNLGPGILYLNGSITQGTGNIILPAGGFRFPDAAYVYIPYQTGIFGFTAQQVIAVSGNGYIVARYSITPTVSNATNYSFPTSYYFVATPLSTDCVVCTITAGNISGYGNFLINAAATQAEVNTGTIISKAVVPSTLAQLLTSYAKLSAGNAFTGLNTAPTAALETNTTQLANTAFAYNLKGNFKTVVAISTTSTLSVADMGKVIENVATLPNINLILPNVSTVPNGSVVGLYNASTYNMTISTQANQQINNGTQHAVTISIPSGGSFILYTDQTSWTMIALGGSMTTVSSFGVGQNWQNYDVVTTRQWNITYTNTTSKAIVVQVQGTSTTAAPSIYPIVDGVTLAGNGGVFNITVVVPPGQTYQMQAANITLNRWVELR